MIIHIVRKYLELSNNNTIPPVLCELDNDHGSLMPNLDENDEVFLYCLACEFKIHLGINSIQDMFETVLRSGTLDK